MDQRVFSEENINQVESDGKQLSDLKGINSLNIDDSPHMDQKDNNEIEDLVEGAGNEYVPDNTMLGKKHGSDCPFTENDPSNVDTSQIDATGVDKDEKSCGQGIQLINLRLINGDDENLEIQVDHISVNDDSTNAVTAINVDRVDFPEKIQDEKENSFGEGNRDLKIDKIRATQLKAEEPKLRDDTAIITEDQCYNGLSIDDTIPTKCGDKGAGENETATENEIEEPRSIVDSDAFDDMFDVATSRHDGLHMPCLTVENPQKRCNKDVPNDSIFATKLNAASRQLKGKECTETEETDFEHLKKELVRAQSTKRDCDQTLDTKTGVVTKTNDVETPATKTLRVVLIGQTGAGKSSTGNTLLGAKRFKASPSSKSCTEMSQRESMVKGGLILEIVDTPGLFDTHKPAEELRKEFLNCMMMTNPGPHAFLLILKMNRITEQEKNTINSLKEIFGGDQFLSHTIIVITRKEDFEATLLNNTEKTNEDINKLFQTTLENSPDLHHMVMQCKNRCFLLSNRGKVDGIKRTEQANQLLSVILEMTQANGDTFYSYQYFIDLEEERKLKLKIEAERKEEEERLKRELKQKENLAKIRERELELELERAEMERERERERARKENERLEANLRQERLIKEQLQRQREREREQERYIAELERERERKERKREKLRHQNRMAEYYSSMEESANSKSSSQWGCVMM